MNDVRAPSYLGTLVNAVRQASYHAPSPGGFQSAFYRLCIRGASVKSVLQLARSLCKQDFHAIVKMASFWSQWPKFRNKQCLPSQRNWEWKKQVSCFELKLYFNIYGNHRILYRNHLCFIGFHVPLKLCDLKVRFKSYWWRKLGKKSSIRDFPWRRKPWPVDANFDL